jgi:hypothetical protein
VDDPHPWCVAELNRLPGEREHAGDDRLRGDDGRCRRERDERIERPRRREQIERVDRRSRVLEQQRALAEVVERQRDEHDGEPVDLDRQLAEVAEVGVQRLAAGRDGDRAENGEAVQPVPQGSRRRRTD